MTSMFCIKIHMSSWTYRSTSWRKLVLAGRAGLPTAGTGSVSLSPSSAAAAPPSAAWRVCKPGTPWPGDPRCTVGAVCCNVVLVGALASFVDQAAFAASGGHEAVSTDMPVALTIKALDYRLVFHCSGTRSTFKIRLCLFDIRSIVVIKSIYILIKFDKAPFSRTLLHKCSNGSWFNLLVNKHIKIPDWNGSLHAPWRILNTREGYTFSLPPFPVKLYISITEWAPWGA